MQYSRVLHSSNSLGHSIVVHSNEQKSVFTETFVLGWMEKPKTTFSLDSALCLMGRFYDIRPLIVRNHSRYVTNGLEDFKSDCIGLIWLTYRMEFSVLPGSMCTTDCGWGSTLRTSQMLIAQGILVHYFGLGELL